MTSPLRGRPATELPGVPAGRQPAQAPEGQRGRANRNVADQTEGHQERGHGETENRPEEGHHGRLKKRSSRLRGLRQPRIVHGDVTLDVAEDTAFPIVEHPVSPLRANPSFYKV